MGFFGFLKKGESVAPPAKPAAALPRDEMFPPEHDIPLPPSSNPDLNFSFPENEMEPGPSIAPPPSAPTTDPNATALPDFTTDEIAEAERLAKEELSKYRDMLNRKDPMKNEEPAPAEEPVHELAQLPELEEPEVKITPIENDAAAPDVEEAVFVSAIDYRDALASTHKLRESLRKGDAHLKTLLDEYAAHKDPYVHFAEQLNSIQEKLIQVDNQLVR